MLSRKHFLALGLLMITAANAMALGLSINPGEIIVDNLKIGQSYDVSKLARPLTINYYGGMQNDLAMEVYPPKDPRPGYEVIPDTSWVLLDKDVYTALPGESVNVAVVLKIPNDEKYFGRKFDVRMRCVLKPRAQEEGVAFGLAPAVETRILFSIYKEKGSQEEQDRLEQVITKSRNISFMPTELIIKDVPVGRKVDVKKELKKSMKLTNLNDEAVEMEIKCIPPEGVGGFPDYLPIKDNMITLEKTKIKVKSNQVDDVKFYVNFPDKEEYHNKHFMAICEAAINTDVLKTQYRVRIFLTTK